MTLFKRERLCRTLKYQFKNSSLLEQALTHRSAGHKNNERLEFLGDSILNFVIAHALYERFPEVSEGQLSRLRAHLVRGEMLAIVAQTIDLGDYLLLGQGELKSGGYRRESILANTLEALFGAIYLDGDFANCQQVILNLYASQLQNEQLELNVKDAKTDLQEYLQRQKLELPNYKLIKVVGEMHEQIFHTSCTINNPNHQTIGEGPTRRKAEQIAAQKMLDWLVAE